MSTTITALGPELERRFRTKVSSIPSAGTPISLLHPANADDLITEADYVRDERLPYWADVWPAAVVLGEALQRRPRVGTTLLELGCGSGVVASAAARAGYTVTATDYYDDAVLFARWNAWTNAAQDIETRVVDWRAMPDDLGPFDVVVASDVLYEKSYGLLVARAIRFTLSRTGVAIVADPGRLAAPAFVRECELLGMHVTQSERVPYEDGPVKQTVDLWEIRR